MQHRIIVLGAGYAGASAAGRLARRLHRDDVCLTLVNAEPDFVERVRNHELATGRELPRRPLADLLAGTGVELKVARVTAVDVDRKVVTVTGDTGGSGAEELAYDTLVYALGSRWNDQGVPGAAEHAYEIAGRAGALRVRERLAGLTAGQPVVVVGGGLTGLEAATEIAESRPDLDVTLAASDGLGDWLSPKGRGHLRAVFARLGITARENARVTAVEDGRVVTADGTVLPSALTVWTARLRRPPHRPRHDPGGRRHRTDRGRRHHALGLAPGRVRRRRRGPGAGARRQAAADVLRDRHAHRVAGRRRDRGAPHRRQAARTYRCGTSTSASRSAARTDSSSTSPPTTAR